MNTKAPRKKLTEKQKLKIVADYVACNNYSEVGRRHKISGNAVKKIVLASPEYSKKFAQKKEQTEIELLAEIDKLGKDVLAIYSAGIDRIYEMLGETRDIQRIATAIGILLDKQTKRQELQFKQQEIDLKKREVVLKEKQAEEVGGDGAVRIIIDSGQGRQDDSG
jgi:transposase-like protein